VGGPLAGALFLTAVAEVVRERFQVGHLVFYGLCMMLVIRFLPEGIWGRLHRRIVRPRRAAADVALGG
jgi:ABC-type branched-subunit amino acid transport system permease subunit